MAILKDLIVNGSSRFLNKTYFSSIRADTVDAEEGIFKKLIATDANLTNATVVGLLDVQGEMHTNSWSNSNIATIDGNFYITPTAVSADGTDTTASGYTPTGTITYSNTNYTQMTITGTFDTSQLTLDGTSSIAWSANSYVIVTGDVLVGNEWYPLGTIRGKLSAQVAANTSSKTFTIIPIGTQIISGEVGNVSLTDGNGHKPLTLEAIRTAGATLTSLKLRKVKISMTSRGSGSDQYALGIYMTAMGGNKKTFLDIYGGSNKNGVDISSTIGGTTYQSGAFAKPTVRIGNLLGLPAIQGITPTGWGIYTTNGFFSGTVVARQGKIGDGETAWTIGSGSGTGSVSYIYAPTNGPKSKTAQTVGMYIGTDGINNFQTTGQYVRIYDGKIYAQGADIAGEIKADTGRIGGTSGWTIAAQQISNGSIGTNDSMFLSTKNLAGTVSGRTLTTTAPSWRLTVGSNFGVDNTGKLYASGAELSGNVAATQGFTVTSSVGGQTIASMTGSGISLGPITSTSYYNMLIDTGGIKLRYNTTVLNLIDSTGMTLKNSSGSILAEFKSYMNLGTGHTNTYTGSAAMGVGLTATKTNQIVVGRYNESNANATFIIGDGTSSSDKSNLLTVGNLAGKQITDTFIGDGDTKIFTLSNTPTSTPTVIRDESSTTTYTISSWSGTAVTLNTNVVENERIQFQYTTNEKGGYLVIGNIGGTHGKGAIVGGDFSNGGTMTALGVGTSIHGHANNSTMTATLTGASIHGYAADSIMMASGSGASIHGLAYEDSKMISAGSGTAIHGFTSTGTMRASGDGTSVYGCALRNSTMEATYMGASVHGYASNNSTMIASMSGASIHGAANNSTMTASGSGALIHGYADDSTMTASKAGSVALNEATHALARAQLAIGTYNKNDSITTTTHPSGKAEYGTYAFIIGNGTSESARSNALTVDWEGNLQCNNIGTTWSESKTVNVTANVDNYATGPTITLPAGGVYVVHAFATFPSNGTEAARRVRLYNVTNQAHMRIDSKWGKNYVTATIMDTFQIDGSTNITYRADASAGVAISGVSVYLKAVRIV